MGISHGSSLKVIFSTALRCPEAWSDLTQLLDASASAPDGSRHPAGMNPGETEIKWRAFGKLT